MSIKVGINGMGRIGRMIIRSIIENNNKNIKIKHINNRTNPETCSSLLKYDSIHGKFKGEVDFDENSLNINKNKITFSQETKIDNINWKKYTGTSGLNLGIDNFGKSAPYEDIYKHFKLDVENIVQKIKKNL